MGPTLHLPEWLTRWLPPRDWLRVVPAEDARISSADGTVPLEIHRVPSGVTETTLEAMFPEGRRVDRHVIPLVTSPYLRREVRRTLEQRGVGYLDARGHLHLPWRNGLIHLGDSIRPQAHEATSSLGAHGVRAVQAILDEPESILVTALARSVHLSPSRAHTILKLLESEGLVRSTGIGPATRRHVIDRGQLLDWLAIQPAARRREKQLDVALYARTPEEAWRRVRERLDREHVPHAITGSAAAAVMHAGPTSIMVSGVRIAPEVPLEDAARALDATPLDRGANIRLIRDTGMVGTLRTSEHDGVRIAPFPRVYLDALGERRGEDVAQHFREVVLGY